MEYESIVPRCFLRMVVIILAGAVMLFSGGTALAAPLTDMAVQAYLPSVASQAAAAASAPSPTPAPTATPSPPGAACSDAAGEQAMADLLNAERAKRGLGPLRVVSALQTAARGHSCDMAAQDFFSHTGSDGSSSAERMSDAGYAWSACGEIIGWTSGYTREGMVTNWMDSAGHRDIILSTNLTEFGVGYARSADGDHYWTVDFGRPAQ